ncbi:hypothetical protein A2153_03815 [Candidatus Gottesmanbacteria bacterium RBG_16_38_7b]|uniref:DUF3105 domain-containing protein n=1 Tax=Candidatus Gottesmanbacteria bacterium RBG_16_38_7b TaxID=1798372 RepID=A0A1F5YHT8_9BACT|nr:MAG: hypothetical protein A2153_03815 [Candidatus Gottesmanbacteria bacterium RBG_16_38_7b]
MIIDMEHPEHWHDLPKKERKKLKREFYRHQMDKQLRLENIKKYAIFAAISLTVLFGGYWFVKETSKPKPGEFVPSLGNKHIQNITDPHEPYNSNPPTSGTHVGGKAQWGVSDSPIPDELQLHNLEDGGVMVQYNCAPEKDDCQRLISDLAKIANKYPEEVTLAPYPKLDTRIALTAWTRIDKFNDFNSERIEKFINSFRGIDHHAG